MKNGSFGGINGRLVAAAAVTVALFVPLAVFGAPALARSASAASQYQYSGASQYQYRVTLCHRSRSHKHSWVMISVGSRAVKLHLRHGDTMPPCLKFRVARHHGSPPHTGSHSGRGGHGQGSGSQNGNGGNNQSGNGGNQNGKGSKGNGHRH